MTTNSVSFPSKFLRNSAIFAAGDLLTKGARIVLIPYYVRVLSGAEIGQLAILQSILYATWALLAFGLGFALRRFYHEYGERGDAFAAGLWWGRLIVATPAYLCLLFIGWLLTNWYPYGISFSLIAMAISAGFLKAGLNIAEARYVIRSEPVKYRLFTFFQFLTSTLLILYFVSVRKMGVAGALWGELLSYSAWTVLCAVLFRHKGYSPLSAVNWRECIRYCLPAIPHFFFMWGLAGFDRLVLARYVSMEQVGVYEIGYLLASGLSIVSVALRSAWLPDFFRNADQPAAREAFVQTANVFLFFIMFAALFAFAFADVLVPLFASESYGESATVFRIVLCGNVFFACFVAMNQPLFYDKRTGLIAMISGAGLFANLAVNLMLVPRWGILGAATATVIAYLLVAVMAFLCVQHTYQLPWKASRVLRIVVSGVGLASAIYWLLPHSTTLTSLLMRSTLVAVFPLLALLRIERTESTGSLRLSWTGKTSEPRSTQETVT